MEESPRMESSQREGDTNLIKINGITFGPNDIAIELGRLLKQRILPDYYQQAGIDNYYDGISSHIANYMRSR